ncbi:MAG: PA2779 family protein, partial [Nitrospirota bacterium]
LSDFGLTADEISSRLNSFSSDQLHKIATHIDQVDAGGDSALGVIITLLVIAILVIVVLQLMGRQVIIK